jgi:hypothetical protein
MMTTSIRSSMHLVFLAPLPFRKQLVPFVKHFVKDVVDIFGDVYLRAPNAQDIARLVSMNSARGFLDMLGSIDCMHWRWDKCPTTCRGV